MPLAGTLDHPPIEPPYFHSLDELDTWASTPPQKLTNTLGYKPRRSDSDGSSSRGRLLVCHDYKGGYTESAFSQCYTFNFWSSCDTFIYFSHHRVTIPPSGWINSAHRHGAKILGTLIFEEGGGPDALRLLVGKLPGSSTGPAAQSTTQLSLPLSSHYVRVLSDLAVQRGFDGYLLNFEVPLQGSVEQTRALAAWITILQATLKEKVGPHAEVVWYDSVVVNGTLAWQDRLDSLNLPFFLSSTGLFTNYTWPNNYPNDTASYFTSLDPALTGNLEGTLTSHVGKKSLNDIYVGVDVWGRGSHGNGGFGCYKAIDHIDPQSLGLSVALFGQAWTWESEQDKRGFSWDTWWDYERKFWVGNPGGPNDLKDIKLPKMIKKKGEPDCSHGTFMPIASFFPKHPAPDPYDLPFHTTFCPGIGRCWWVNGFLKHRSEDGWTDIDKQTSIGDLVWPKPKPEWEGEAPKDVPLPEASAALSMDEAWNGGNSLKLTLTYPGTKAEAADFQCVWLPIQSLGVTGGKTYDAVFIVRPDSDLDENLDISVGVKSGASVEVINNKEHTQLAEHWTKVEAKFTVAESTTVAIGLVIATVMPERSKARTLPISIGQLNVYASQPPSASEHLPMLLWADWHLKEKKSGEETPAGTLAWEVAASLPILPTLPSAIPDDPSLAWSLQPSDRWFPTLLYANIYALHHPGPGRPLGGPQNAIWVGTSPYNQNTFVVMLQNLPSQFERSKMVRFYVQGVTDRGEVLDWDKCVFVDAPLA